MDIFDAINFSFFSLNLLSLAARMTFWKQKGKLLNLRASISDLLLMMIGSLSLSVLHHWNASHRHQYQFILAVSAVLASLWKCVDVVVIGGQNSQREQERKA